jgi:hypothetical protein
VDVARASRTGKETLVVDLTEIAGLMEANLLQVFNERDPARRREVIARTYAADVRWTDDDGTTVGHDELNTKAQQLLDGPLARLEFVKKGGVCGTTGLGLMAFDLIADGDDTPVVSGFDVAVIEDHRISELWTVLTTSPA